MSGKKLLIISLAVIVVLAIPLTIYLLKQQQDLQSRATPATTLAFSPQSSTKNVGEEISLDVMVNPGSNLVSFVSVDITFDPEKLEPVGGNSSFTVNGAVFPSTLQGPVATTGRIRVNVSTGSDPTKAVSSTQRLGTVKFKALESTSGTTKVEFGTAGNASSIGGTTTGSDDSAAENVLLPSAPAEITILGAAVPTAIPTTTTPSTAPTTVVPSTATPSTATPSTAAPTPTTRPATPTLRPATPTTAPTTQATNPSTSPTLIAQGPTSSPTPLQSGSTNNASAFVSSTPTPTIGAVGPGTTFIGFGLIVVAFTLIGSLLFFTL